MKKLMVLNIFTPYINFISGFTDLYNDILRLDMQFSVEAMTENGFNELEYSTF